MPKNTDNNAQPQIFGQCLHESLENGAWFLSQMCVETAEGKRFQTVRLLTPRLFE